MAASGYADEAQIARILEEGWPYREIAIRAGVDSTSAFRWSQKAYASMPWAAAALLCAQAEAMVQLTPGQVTALYELRSRAALGRSRPRRMPAWAREPEQTKQTKQEIDEHAFD